MKKSKMNLNLSKLKEAVPLAYESKFNFGSTEIDQNEREILIKNESIFVKKFKEYSLSKYEMCKALAEIHKVLKESGTFVEWYQSLGITKDKIYELLNRYKLYEAFTGDKVKIEWVSSLPEQAITFLNRKYVEPEDLYEVFDKGLKKAADIECYLEDKRHEREIKTNNSVGFKANENATAVIQQNRVAEKDEVIDARAEDGNEEIQTPLFEDFEDENSDEIQEAEIVDKSIGKNKDLIRNLRNERHSIYYEYQKILGNTPHLEIVNFIKKIIIDEENELTRILNVIAEKEKDFKNILKVGDKVRVHRNNGDRPKSNGFNIGDIRTISKVYHEFSNGLHYELNGGHILNRELIFDTHAGELIEFKKVE